MKTKLLLTIICVFLAQVGIYADKWVTTCETKIWTDTNCSEMCGQVSAGNEYEALEQTPDGKWLCIDYLGNKAYIPLADCKRAEEAAANTPSQTSVSSDEAVKQSEPAQPKRSDNVQELKEYSATVPASQNPKATEKIQLTPTQQNLLIAFMAVFGIIFFPIYFGFLVFAIMWTFKFGKLRSWINKKAGEDVVPDCRLHPLMWKGLWLYLGCALYLVPGIIYAIYEYKKSLKHRSVRATRWKSLYVAFATLTCAFLIVLTFWLIAIYLAIGAGGKIVDYTLKSDNSSRPSTAGRATGPVCNNCRHYWMNSCPHDNILKNPDVDTCDSWKVF